MEEIMDLESAQADLMERVPVKKWMAEEKEFSGEVEGDCGLDTTRRRRPRLSNDGPATEVDEAAADEDASMGDDSRTISFEEDEGAKIFDSDGTTLKSTETEFFVTDKKIENGNFAFSYIWDDLLSLPEEGDKQDCNHVKVGNGPNLHANTVENVEDVVTAAEPENQSHGHNVVAKTFLSVVSGLDKQDCDHIKVENGPNLHVNPVENVEDVMTAAETESQSHVQNEVCKTFKLDVSGLDLEKVLEEQETHDLFCPNCHSCITKRVILRKRKRRVQDFQYEERPEKLHVRPNIVVSSTETVETNHYNEPDIFRCLSCFSFFSPTENGFNIFRIFRKRDETVNVQVPSIQSSGQTSARDGNWLSSIFKAESGRNKGNEAAQPQLEVSFGGDHDLEESHGITALPMPVPEKVEESYASNGQLYSGAQISVVLDVSSDGEQLRNKNKNTLALPAANAGENYSTILKIDSDHDIIKPIVIVEPSTSQGTSQKDLSIDISASQPAIFLPVGDVQISVGNQILVETRRENEWELLKSIVYGGLIESITSLGVVSSAAGAKTSTLNIVAIGFANLIGGFFVMLHDLSELKSSAAATQKDEQTGRYWKLLGRRSNFGLHATVAIISYIFFGLLPPIIYGFSFRERDLKEEKLIAVASSSLLCIAFLSMGKAHVSEPKFYIKTFLYYLGLGFSASGLSYVAGVMLHRFLEQLGLFEHDIPLPLPPPPPLIDLFGIRSGVTSWAAG